VARLRPDAAETHLARGSHLYFGALDYNGALAELDPSRVIKSLLRQVVDSAMLQVRCELYRGRALQAIFDFEEIFQTKITDNLRQ